MTHLRNFWFHYLVSACALATLCSAAVAHGKRQFDYVTYSVPRGFIAQSESNPNARAYLKQFSNGEFALLTLYSSTQSFGDPQGDFSRRWQQLIAAMTATKKEPSTTRSPLGSAVAITGYETITFNNQPAAAVLLTVTVKAQLLTFVSIFSGEKSGKDAQTFLEGITVDDERIPTARSLLVAPTIQTPRTAPPMQSNANSQGVRPVIGSRILGRWQNHYATPTSSRLLGEYIFKTGGRFANPMNIVNTKKYTIDGSYQLSGDRLLLTYDNGITENFTIAFDDTPSYGEPQQKILLTDVKGDTRHFFFAREQRW
jgi:hypothetical protein